MTVALLKKRPAMLDLPSSSMKFPCPPTDCTHVVVNGGQATTGSTRTRVRFLEEVTIHNSVVDRLNAPHPDSIWYSKHELDLLKKEVHGLIKAARVAGSNDDYLRGLEDRFSRRTLLESRGRKFAVRYAVFREQNKQKLQNICDPERIRRKSAVASKSGRERAFQLADKDALEAMQSETRSKRLRLGKSSNYRRTGGCRDKTAKIHIDHKTRTIVF